jgi:acetyl esterase
MTLAPEIQNLLDMMAQIEFAGLHTMSAPEARALFANMPRSNEPADVAATIDTSFTHGDGIDVPVRIYVPEGDGPFGALIWYHGGGFVIGDLETTDGTARELCAHAGVVVVSVDYRLAPEHPFPAAIDDAVGAAAWIAGGGAPADAHIDPTRLAVGGDSAGGNLAAATALAARDRGLALRHQVLVYPVVDLHMRHPSITDNGEGYFLTKADMTWFMDAYATLEQRTDPLASPLLADDLSGLAAATVVTAQYDPLRDEGDEYAERLAAAGVAVDHAQYGDMIHGFLGMTSLTQSARDARDRIAANVRAALA